MATQLKGNAVSNWFYNFGLALVPHVPNPLNARIKITVLPEKSVTDCVRGFFLGSDNEMEIVFGTFHQ